jgi:hypothetical protein
VNRFGSFLHEKLRHANVNFMKKTVKKQKPVEELRKEYDPSSLQGGVRGKYFERYRAGTNLVLLSPDVAEHFPSEEAVNSALRALIRDRKRPARRSR